MPVLCALAASILSCTKDDLPKDVTLPRSTSARGTATGDLRLVLSRSQLQLGTEVVVPKLPAAGPFGTDGFDAADKRDGDRHSYLVEPLLRALRAQSAQVPSGAKGADLVPVLFVDASTPYRPFTELLHTLGQIDIVRLRLVVLVEGKRASLEVKLPTAASIGVPPGANEILEQLVAAADASAPIGASLGADRPRTPPRTLSSFVNVTVERGKVTAKGPATSCDAPSAQIPLVLDCVRKAKGAGAPRPMLVLSAEQTLDLQSVVRIADALAPELPDVAFGLGK